MKKYQLRLLSHKTGHYYFFQHPIKLPDGIWLPSATNILDTYPNKGLDFWKTNSTPEEIAEKQTSGKNQGTKMHHCIDLGIKGQQIAQTGVTDEQIKILGLSDKKLVRYLKEPLTEREAEALVGVENFAKDFAPRTIANEIMVYSLKHRFAGTCDWVGYLRNQRTGKYELYILDWKISKTKSRSNELQVVAYSKALVQMHPRTKELATAKCATIYFGSSKFKYNLVEVKDKELAFKKFLAAKELWDDANPKLPKFDTTLQENYSFNMNNEVEGKLLKLN